MGCLNNKVETDKLPSKLNQHPSHQEYPPAVAFDIPVNDPKSRKKPARLDKQLYIIREVSHLNNDIGSSNCNSPKKQITRKGSLAFEEGSPNIPEQQPVKTKRKSHSRKSSYLDDAASSTEEKKGNRSKTVNFIPQDNLISDRYNSSTRRNRIKGKDKNQQKSNHSFRTAGNRSQHGRRIEEFQIQDSAGVKHIKTSQEQPPYGRQSVHFKRAKTVQDQTNFLSHLSRQSNQAPSNRNSDLQPQTIPIYIQSKQTKKYSDYQSEIKEVILHQGNQSPQLISLYQTVAELLIEEGELDKAIGYNLKQTTVIRKVYGMDTALFGAAHSNLSSIHLSLGNYQKGVQNAAKAKAIRQFAASQSDMHKARVLNSMALIELQQNNLKQATHLLQQVAEIHSKVAHTFHLSEVDIQTHISDRPSKNQYYNKSVKSMEKALSLCTRIFGQNHLQTANHLDDLGTSYYDAGKYSQFLTCYQRCFRIMNLLKMTKHKQFQTHLMHYNLNLEHLRFNNHCSNQDLARAIAVTEEFIPKHGMLLELKRRLNNQGEDYHVSSH